MNGIFEEGQNALANSLSNNVSLTELCIEGNCPMAFYFAAIGERNMSGIFHKVCKVMVVGDARMGKTSLVRSLNNEAFNQDESVTNVVEICGMHFPDSDVSMKVFDFGGQEIFNFIHPMFLSSHQCIVILVVNEFKQSLERIKQQIEFLRSFHQKEILVVSTCFTEIQKDDRIIREDQPSILSDDQITWLGLEKNRFLRISNKDQVGIEVVKREIQEIGSLKTIGWTLCERCNCLRNHFESVQNKLPIIPLSSKYLDIDCEHNHTNVKKIQKDLTILDRSGWIFLFWDKNDQAMIFTGEKLIVKLFQGLFTINNFEDGNSRPVSLVKNGLMTQAAFKNYYRSLLQYSDFTIPTEVFEEIENTWESALDFICSFSICHKIVTRSVGEGLIPSILFPSLLPTYQLSCTKPKWKEFNSICLSHQKQKIARNFTTSTKYDQTKLIDFIFPRLLIKLWHEVIDVELCCLEKFVVRGDHNADDFNLQLKNLKNFMIVERQGNDISIICYGNCCGIIYQLEGELKRLFGEFRKCYNIIQSSQQQKEDDYYWIILCSQCSNYLPRLMIDIDQFDQIYQFLEQQHECKTCKEKFNTIERIDNVSDLLRIYFLLKNFGRATSRQLLKRVEDTLGDFANFPRNNILSFHDNKNLWKDITLHNLEVHHKLKDLSTSESLFQCCIQPLFEEESEKVMVNKYFHCKTTDYSPNVLSFAEIFRNFAEMLTETEIFNDVADISQLILKKVKTNEDVGQAAAQALQFLENDCEEIQANHKQSLIKIISTIQKDNEREMLLIDDFISQFMKIRSEDRLEGESLFVAFSTCVENIKNGGSPQATLITVTGDPKFDSFIDNCNDYLAETPSILTSFNSHFDKLKELFNSDFYSLFREEFYLLELEEIEGNYLLMGKILQMVNKVATKISRANEIEVMQQIRSKRNLLQPKEGSMFLEVPLHCFDGVVQEDSDLGKLCDIERDKSVLVELSNIFDGPLKFEPFTIIVYPWETKKVHTYGQVLKTRLVLFLQLCYGVRELNSSQIVHRNLTLENTLYLKRSNWVCISGFGSSIKCPNKKMLLSREEHKGICGVSVRPPELDITSSSIKMDKFDVHSLGLILTELIDSICISCRYADQTIDTLEVLELLKKLQGYMECAYKKRFTIHQVIGVIEWILYSSNQYDLCEMKRVLCDTEDIWMCETDEDISQLQKSILLKAFDQNHLFSLEEMMEIEFIFTFTRKNRKKIEKSLRKLSVEEFSWNQQTLQQKKRKKKIKKQVVDHILYLTRHLKNISLQHLKIHSVLGGGAAGVVWLVEVYIKQQPIFLAMKMIFNFPAMQHPTNSNDFSNEFSIVYDFPTHPNIINILSDFHDVPNAQILKLIDPNILPNLLSIENSAPLPTQFFLVEYHPITLKQKLDSLGRSLHWEEIYKYSSDLIRCSYFLFKQKVVHRDIKLDNILVSKDDRLILSDFGESIKTDEDHCCKQEDLRAGNRMYQAPEVLNAIPTSPIINFTKQYSWEIGCVIFQLMQGSFPFPNYPSNKYGSAPNIKVRPPKIKQYASSELTQLVLLMLKNDAEERMSIEEAREAFKTI